MKKITLLSVLVIVLGVVISGCAITSNPVDYSIGEMEFTLDDNSLSQITDEEELQETLIEIGLLDEDEIYDDYFGDILYFNGNKYSLLITTRYVTYPNYKIEEAIENAYNWDSYNYTSSDLQINNVKGKLECITAENGNGNEIYSIDLLKDGILYNIEMDMQQGASYPENYLEELANTIVFNSELLENITYSCGDINYQLMENYQEVEDSDDEDDAYTYDYKHFALCGDSIKSFEVCYLKTSDYNGCTLQECATILSEDSDFSSSEITSAQNNVLGEMKCINGNSDEYGNMSMIVTQLDDRFYLFGMYDEENDVEDTLLEIVSSVSLKE